MEVSEMDMSGGEGGMPDRGSDEFVVGGPGMATWNRVAFEVTGEGWPRPSPEQERFGNPEVLEETYGRLLATARP